MKPTFNLLDEPWIPCIPLEGNGRPEQLSLRETLARAHEIREIHSDSPLSIAALHRLMLAILHRVFGPEDRWIWADLWQGGEGQWEVQTLDEYLSKWRSRFYLFDEQYPFYQVKRFPGGMELAAHPVSQLAYERASGNNTVLFDHHTDAAPESLSLAEAARRLVTIQAFTIGFGKSYKENGKWVSFQDGPCARGALFLVQGDNLFQTLLLSMREYPSLGSRLPDDMERDRPVWEWDDPFIPKRMIPFGYLDFLTWQSLRIQLLPENTPGGIRVSQIRRIQGLGLSKADVHDPLKSYREDWSVRGFVEGKALWRDSVALFELVAESKPRSTPENFSLLARLVYRAKVLRREEKYRYAAFGLATEKGQARNVAFWRHERMPLPLAYLTDEDAVARLRDALQLAERVSWRLENAREWLAWLLHKPDENRGLDDWQKSPDYKKRKKNTGYVRMHSKFPVALHYWWRLEEPFKSAMVGLAGEHFEAALLEWRGALKNAAKEALGEVTAKLAPTPQHFKATAQARSELEYRLNITLKVDEGRHNEKESTY